MTNITDDQIATLADAAGKATQGPWELVDDINRSRGARRMVGASTHEDWFEATKNGGVCYAQTIGPDSHTNAEYIALANPETVLSLVNRVRSDASYIARLQSICKAVVQSGDPNLAVLASLHAASPNKGQKHD